MACAQHGWTQGPSIQTTFPASCYKVFNCRSLPQASCQEWAAGRVTLSKKEGIHRGTEDG